MTLDSLCGQYALERDIAPDTAKWLGYVANNYGRWLKHAATVADLADSPLNEWLAALIADGLSRRTVRGYRGAIVMLWRYAYELGSLEHLPRRLRKIKVDPLVPCAWSEDELVRLLEQAIGFAGAYRCGVRRSTFWVALILAIWDTGLRIGDLLRLDRSQVNDDGVGTVVQRKTNWPIVFQLSPRTLALLKEVTQDDRATIFGGVICRKTVFVTFKRIATAAGLAGGTKKIRKSGATAVERATPGAAMAYLGHRTPGLAYQYYVDPRLVGEKKPMPPPLSPPNDAA